MWNALKQTERLLVMEFSFIFSRLMKIGLPPMWPGFDSRTRRHMWVVVGSRPCSKRFFSGYSGFPLSSKTNIFKFHFDLDYCQALYHKLLALEVVQALPVLFTLNVNLYRKHPYSSAISTSIGIYISIYFFSFQLV